MALPLIEPAKLTRIREPFDGADWVFEWKADGFRALAYISEGRCNLVSRKRNHYKKFEGLKTALATLKVRNAILDGELVCLNEDGNSNFHNLLYRRAEPCFYAFDLLWVNGRDLRELPLIERKNRLRMLIVKSKCDRIIYAQHVERRGTMLYREVCERDGIKGRVLRHVTEQGAPPRWLRLTLSCRR